MAKTEQSEKLTMLSGQDVAELLGVTVQTVRNWMNSKGLPFKDGQRGRLMQWPEVLEWYVEMRKSEDGKKGKIATPPPTDPTAPPESMDSALRRRAVAEANLKELDLAERVGEVVSIEDVERNIAAVALNIQNKILAIPTRLTPRLVGIDDRNQIRALLDAEMHLICNELVTVGAETAKRTPREEDEE